MPEFTYNTESAAQTKSVGESIGQKLKGGEVFELISDLGGGKTTLVSGLSEGFGSSDPVASPSFTISYVYTRADGKALHHFDFYRLNDAGIVANELEEVEGDADSVVAVEWGDIVHDVLPSSRIIIKIMNKAEENRRITISAPEEYKYLFEESGAE